MIKNKIVIFDWGGVIESHRQGEYNIRNAIIDIMKKYGCTLNDEKIIEIYSNCSINQHNNYIFSKNDSSELKKWFENVKSNLGINCSLEQFLESYYNDLKKVFYYQKVVDYAHDLKNKCNIGIFSNLMQIDEERINYQVDLKHFNYVFLSYQIGCRKPDEKAYKIVEKSVKMKPENILFIDDCIDNLIVAQKRGWQICNACGYELDKIMESVDEFLK